MDQRSLSGYCTWLHDLVVCAAARQDGKESGLNCGASLGGDKLATHDCVEYTWSTVHCDVGTSALRTHIVQLDTNIGDCSNRFKYGNNDVAFFEKLGWFA